MRLYTPRGLAYPITVTALKRKVGDTIEQNDALFSYRYTAPNVEWNPDTREDETVERTYVTDYQSEVEGSINSIDVKAGQVINGRTAVADIEEPCRHEVQFGGMCANCGQDMTEKTYNTTKLNTERATVNTVHSHTALLVSQEEASKADVEAKRRLLDAKKLSLVVDLDQTIIHATVDKTVAEWQRDTSNPNHEAVKDVRAFQLLDDGPGAKGMWYYIKLRPGLKEFLDLVAQYYELHVYTMATRAYAENVAKIIDPDRKLFGDRILSRDENGSMSFKSLKRLFPVDANMVVIIDDRGDVWSWSLNLIKVSAFDFFVGIGDINSSFLPKRPELEARPQKSPKTEEISNGTTEASPVPAAAANGTAPIATSLANGEASAVDKMVSMDEGDLQEKADEHEKTIAAQLEDRPLLKMQKILDEKEEEAAISPAVEAAGDMLADGGDNSVDPSHGAVQKYRHNLLQDDDEELHYLGKTLVKIHANFYEEYSREAVGSKGGRIAELRPGSSKKRAFGELDNLPDAAVIMSEMKRHVLFGVNIVFSGVIPIGVDVRSHDIAIWAKSFGATVSESISKHTTHLIASPERRTAKVRQAAKKGGRIAIVNQNWLYACFTEWARVDEDPYRVHTAAPANDVGGLPDSFGEKYFALSSSDEEAAHTEDDEREDPGSTLTKPINGSSLRLNTDKDDLDKLLPTDGEGDGYPVAPESPEEWQDMNDELAEFLGSDWEDSDSDREIESDNESRKSDTSTEAPKGEKRKREPEDEGPDGSRLQKRKQKALSRISSLTNVNTVVANSMPTNEADIDEEGDDDLEAALAAEMAADMEEEST